MVLSVIFVSCSKDDDATTHYTEKQNKAFAIFNGTWADVQYSNLGSYPGAELQPDPDKIVFGAHYQTEREVTQSSYIDGERVAFYAQGECTYYENAYYLDGYKYNEIKCYYNVSPEADILSLWNATENKSFHVYDMKIKSETQIYLYLSGITLPYIFEKQE